jgi:hypothetical protein
VLFPFIMLFYTFHYAHGENMERVKFIHKMLSSCGLAFMCLISFVRRSPGVKLVIINSLFRF